MLSDPRLRDPHARVTALLKTLELYNSPDTTPDGGGSTGKPESRSPGMQQYEWMVRDAAALLTRTADEIERRIANSHPREAATAPTASVGGMVLRSDEGAGLVDEVLDELRAQGAKFGSVLKRDTGGRFAAGAHDVTSKLREAVAEGEWRAANE